MEEVNRYFKDLLVGVWLTPILLVVVIILLAVIANMLADIRRELRNANAFTYYRAQKQDYPDTFR